MAFHQFLVKEVEYAGINGEPETVIDGRYHDKTVARPAALSRIIGRIAGFHRHFAIVFKTVATFTRARSNES